MLTSVSATERIKLWDKFTGPVDQDAVRLEFFRKIHSKNPPFRFKVKLAPRNKVKVPEMVKFHYRKPVKLLPSLRDVLRLEYVLKNVEKSDENEVEIDRIEVQSEDVALLENLSSGGLLNNCDSNVSLSGVNDTQQNGEDDSCGSVKQIDSLDDCHKNDDDTDYSCFNGCVNNVLVNGGDADVKLPDVISDITSEGKFFFLSSWWWLFFLLVLKKSQLNVFLFNF